MHELTIVQSFVDMADRCIKDAAEPGDEVAYVTMLVGEMTGVEPKYVFDYYPDVAKGTLLEGVELKVEIENAEVFCRECGNTYHLEPDEAPCPKCGKSNYEILSGDKLMLKEIGFKEKE